jgi:hypothetical protein
MGEFGPFGIMLDNANKCMYNVVSQIWLNNQESVKAARRTSLSRKQNGGGGRPDLIPVAYEIGKTLKPGFVERNCAPQNGEFKLSIRAGKNSAPQEVVVERLTFKSRAQLGKTGLTKTSHATYCGINPAMVELAHQRIRPGSVSR